MAQGTVAVILAAGKGTRMKSAVPKVLHSLGGTPMLARVLAAARTVAERCVIVTAPDADAVRAAVAADDVTFVEQARQHGTGDAMRAALGALAGARRVVVLYADVPLLSGATLARMVETVAEDALGIITVRMPDPTGLGRICRDAGGAVTAIVEEKDADAQQRRIDEINSGLYVMPGARLAAWLERLSPANAQGEYYLTDVVGFAVADGVAVETVDAGDPDEVAGVNDRVQLARLERVLQGRHADTLMRGGVTLMDPARFDLRGELIAAPDCEIDVGCVFEGRVMLGAGVRIGPHCVIRDAEIAAGATIEAHSHISGARIGAGAIVGPFARLREGTELGEGVKIGNFVETKKSVLGAGSKANHLAYLGNATLGAGCNVGAGTITCNYDGVAKHPTRLGDGVFVGSNSTLVAPVELDDGAYVAAGSTITSRVPEGSLGVGRARQRNIDRWRTPKQRAVPADGNDGTGA
ncbi:MAG TPA: bifunctional UDP-N-acetylglucosamine diphosphorylase/glucosamine-1-phosphate N-acetyltransferase GlmU [Pseudomonadales bacterium]|nr:bifunctional UDP-N-acetylglucosamine diphosphorylase/glucosamine-1-phosphate N-acetyltransferase GlmU [Pseudomonadales bacterium]